MPEPPPADATHTCDDRVALLAALMGLPPRQRSVVMLRFWLDMTETQVAEELGGPVSPAVAYLTLRAAGGPVYKLWPVAWHGHRYIGLVVPRDLAVARFTAYSAHGELAYAIPFPVNGFPLIVSWLRPGTASPAPVSLGVNSSGSSTYRWWSVTAQIGPWGTCLVQTAGAGQVSCRPTRSYPPDAVITVMTDRWRGLHAGITGSAIAYIKLKLRNRKTARVPVIHVGGQGFGRCRCSGNQARWPAGPPTTRPGTRSQTAPVHRADRLRAATDPSDHEPHQAP